MKYIQHFLGILVVVLSLGFAYLIWNTDLFPMENWRKNVLLTVLLCYSAYRTYRIYDGIKKEKNKSNHEN